MRLTENKLLPRVACVLVATMVTSAIAAQQAVERPRLVVGVMIEGLTTDQLDLLRDRMGRGGFNRLREAGITIDNIDYGTPLDPAAATAMIYTGATPQVSGIDNATVYSIDQRRDISAFADPQARGTFTDLSLSPRNLMVSTLADEVRIHSDGVGQVHSLALSPEVAIAMSGHAGNSAFWISDTDGAWASTTYYKDLPTVAQRENHYRPLAQRLDTMAWHPALAPADYPDLPSHRRKYPFRVTFGRKDPNRYKVFKATALANAEITNLATDYISSMSLGQRDELDMLNLSYSLAPYPYGKDGDTRAERMDSYIRLDRDLQRLFAAIDSGPGMNRTLLFVAGTPVQPRSRRDDERWGIPHGEFSVRRAQSLLNAFLMAKYGNGDWVCAMRPGGRVYLNRQLINQRGVDLSEIRSEAARFMSRMAGITLATTLDDIVSGRYVGDGTTDRRNIALPSAADIYVTIAPGWEVVEGNESTAQRTVNRAATSTAPMFILAPGVDAHRITTTVDARTVAPTVTGQLRIRSPNGADRPAIALK